MLDTQAFMLKNRQVLLENITGLDSFKALDISSLNSHAYLFYSADKLLNNIIAQYFAKCVVCNSNNACGKCPACQQFNANSHPDVYIMEQDSIKVEDINFLISKLSTTPISADKKVFVILDADKVNEIAQNKMLKSLEEPSPSQIFIMTTTKPDKLLPTVLSRLNKVYVPPTTDNDLLYLNGKLQDLDLLNFIDKGFNLTQIIDMSLNDDFNDTLNCIQNLFNNLNSSSDIPRLVSNIQISNKERFFPILQDVVLKSLKNDTKTYSEKITSIFNNKYPKSVLIKFVNMIDNAYKMQLSNVNFVYILDNLLFQLLKEKYLCR